MDEDTIITLAKIMAHLDFKKYVASCISCDVVVDNFIHCVKVRRKNETDMKESERVYGQVIKEFFCKNNIPKRDNPIVDEQAVSELIKKVQQIYSNKNYLRDPIVDEQTVAELTKMVIPDKISDI